MSIGVKYPAKINKYSIKVSNTGASIRLYGERENTSKKVIGDIGFLENKSTKEPAKAFINRGGFLNASYPLFMLSSILILLNQEETLFLDEDGNFINTVLKS